MYWEGDQEYFGFGCGAASFLNSTRFSRPRLVSQYYKYVDGMMNQP